MPLIFSASNISLIYYANVLLITILYNTWQRVAIERPYGLLMIALQQLPL